MSHYQPQLLMTRFGDYLQHKFRVKVRKLSLDASFSCPNRDGTLGRGGCTFCNVTSFHAALGNASAEDISMQLQQVWQGLQRKASRYIAYFQAYTSTYAETERLQQMYQQALATEDIVGLSVATRPDCLPDQVLDMLAAYQAQGQEIWVELGLQSAHDKTLKRINRGHGFVAYQDAVQRCRQRGLKVCCHLIVGLPAEQEADYFSSLQAVLAEGVEGIKLHPLLIVKNTVMAKAYTAGRLETLTLSDYAAIAARLIQHTPRSVIYHRIGADARSDSLLAPECAANRFLASDAIYRVLQQQGGQGSALTE